MKEQKNIYDMTDRELRAYKRKLRKQREFRRKCMMIVMTICLVVVGVVSYHSISSNASTGTEDLNFKYYTTITVQYGETLWDIAEEYIDYNEYKNKGDYISEVQNINHLSEECDIRAGQILVVPYFSKEFVK